ncbi:Hint domain-containing protein [Roseovarius salinarum]|uniref:Hint domain-containing protein n=1 Tax=Roseovarius salinarum TaxID=1981892 RepID=UPI000C3252BD|nr:Hint domain-containing protein [Roseovarius salinarum]
MPTYTDQTIGGDFDPGYPPPLPTTINVETITLNDADGDGFISPNGSDQVNGSDVVAVYDGDTVTIDGNTITGTTFYTADGGRYFTPTDGSVLPDGGTATDTTFVWSSTQFDVNDLGPPCFVAGTRIAVPGGTKRVEELAIGDLVETMDRGPQPIRWIGRRTVCGDRDLAPVRIPAGAVGNARALLVSPQHRMLLSDWRAQLYAGEDAVLCPAIALVDGGRAERAPCDLVTYVHFMFDRHEVVFAEGAPTESFHLGDYLSGDHTALRREILTVFPELDASPAATRAARPSLRRFEGALVAQAA